MATNREVFTLAGRAMTLAIDDDPVIGRRLWAVVKMRLVDELTGQPPRGAVRLETSETRVTPRVAAGGIAGLVADPAAAFPALAAQSYPFEVIARADGYLPVRIQDEVPQTLTFPADFTPRDLGVVDLHAEPVALRGRVIRRTPAGVVSALDGVTVEVTRFWSRAPTALVPAASVPAAMVALTPPLYANWAAGGPTPGRMRRRTMTAQAGQDKALVAFAAAGSLRVHLSNSMQAQAGRFLAIEPDTPERMEVVQIAAIEVGPSADAPATATLTYPLAFNHARGTLAQRVTLTAPGAAKSITRSASAGDTSLYVNNLTGFAAGIVEVSNGVAAPEFHAARIYRATTVAGGDGYYRLPPIHRAAMLTLRARIAGFTDVALDFAPRYGQPENRLDFVFRQ